MPEWLYNMLEHKDVALAAVQANGFALRHVAYQLQCDLEVVAEAVTQDYLAIEFADIDTLPWDDAGGEDPAGIVAAVIDGMNREAQSIGWRAGAALVQASERAGWGERNAYWAASQRAIMLAVVRLDGRLLRYASDELRADRDVVLEAVRQHAGAMWYAATALKSDAEIKLAGNFSGPSPAGDLGEW